MKLIDTSLASQIEGRRSSLWRNSKTLLTTLENLPELSHLIANDLRRLAWLYDLQEQAFHTPSLTESVALLQSLADNMEALSTTSATLKRDLPDNLPLALRNEDLPDSLFTELPL